MTLIAISNLKFVEYTLSVLLSRNIDLSCFKIGIYLKQDVLNFLEPRKPCKH